MDRISIILAEDHVVVRESIRRFLDRQPDLCVIGEAGDGEEAVRLVTALKPNVLIMDIAMPKLNGIEATKMVKAACPSTAVLVLTAYDYDQYIFAVLESGAAGYLLKDVSGQELIDAIRAVRRGDSALHPAVARKLLARFRKPEAGHEDGNASSLFTDKELEVLKRAAKGMSNKDIAQELALSVRTVEAHLTSLFNKLNVSSRTELVVSALKKGLVALDDIPLK
ncbi:MAG: response regulator transcription factor [Dehalococcoidia bacterium]|nr:response regulator transcription factor [Dehalococcoidia bacterium]